MSKVTFTSLGGSGKEIGASCFLVTDGGKQVLLDSGMHPKKEGRESLPLFPLLRRAPDAVVISHAHIDHCGSLPYLMKQFRGTTAYTTKPTLQIMDRMLHNSVAVMSTLAIERGIRDYPLYTHADADMAVRRTYGLRYHHEFAPAGDSPVRVQFRHAGHVLGSASVLLRMNGHSLYYTSDVCATNQYLLHGMERLERKTAVDTLVIEATRAAQPDAAAVTYEDETERFAEEIREVLARRGAVLVPCFALGRTQEMLNIIGKLQEEGGVPRVPVYASGLGRAIYEVYSKNKKYLRRGTELNPLDRFKRIGDVWDRKVTRQLLKEPCIIVATSGMMVENTPSAMIAREMVQHTQHGIFFVGYLDPDTLGYAVLNAKPGDQFAFERDGAEVTVKLENIQSFQFSAHAPREDLLEVITHIQPRNVVFVHGDAEAIRWMQENVPNQYRKFSPEVGETVALDD